MTRSWLTAVKLAAGAVLASTVALCVGAFVRLFTADQNIALPCALFVGSSTWTVVSFSLTPANTPTGRHRWWVITNLRRQLYRD